MQAAATEFSGYAGNFRCLLQASADLACAAAVGEVRLSSVIG